jgi:hypothetical protein
VNNVRTIIGPSPTGLSGDPERLGFSCKADCGTGLNCPGNGLQFDGVDDEIDVPHAASLSFGAGDPMTVELWFNLSEPRSPVYHLIGKRVACGETNYQVAVGSGELHFSTGPSPAFRVGTPFTATVGQWVHVAATCDGSTVRLYVNGQLKATGAGSLGNENDEPLRIGQSGTCQSDFRFVGVIDEVRIWNVARSVNEIAADYNRTVDPTTPGLVGYWNFDEAFADPTIVDRSGHGNDGTLVSGALRVASTAPTCNTCDGPELFQDNFNDGNDNGWIFRGDGPATHIAGSWSALSGQYDGQIVNNPGKSTTRVTGLADWTDYCLKLDFNIVAHSGSVLLRADAYDANYGIHLVPVDNRVTLQDRFVSSHFVFDFDYNEWHHLRATIIGQTLTCWIDDVLIFNEMLAEQPVITDGPIGLGMNTTSQFPSSRVLWDNVSVTDLTGLPVYFPGTGHWYQVNSPSQPMSWTMARDGAVSLGGYLACIGDQDENEFVKSLLPGPPWNNAAIGGYEKNGEGDWQWVDGITAWGYTNWNSGEPNNNYGLPPNENVVVMLVDPRYYTPGTWNDAPKDNIDPGMLYIVEFDSPPASKAAPEIPPAFEAGAVPSTPILGSNYPNPFNASTVISYRLDADVHVKIEVFDILGRRVSTLVDKDEPAGSHQVIWNGSDAQGNLVASGVYFYRLSTSGSIQAKKMVLLK